MRKAWDWFRALRWWWKTLIVVPLSLGILSGLYILTRAIQYSTEEGSAVVYLPASADFACGVQDLEGEWGRIQETDFWDKLQTKALKDRTTRALLNKNMTELGLPTVDQWNDERWLEDNPLFTEENILRAAGRDAMASLRVGGSFKNAKMLVATKVSFGDYLLLPFSGIAGSFIGAESEGVGNYSALRVDQGNTSYYIVVDGAYVIVSDDKDLLREGLERNGSRPEGNDPFWVTADFDRSPELAKWRKGFRGFPAGAALSFMDAQSARSMKVGVRVTGSSLLVDLQLDGAVALNTQSDSKFVGYAPAEASGYVTQAAGMQEIYDWIQGLIEVDPKATPFEQFVQRQASETVAEFTNAGFESRFLPYAEAPSVIMLGSEQGTGNQTYTAAALLFFSPDPIGAVEGLRDTFKEILQKYGTFSEEDLDGIRLIYFDRPSDPLQLNNYLRPCMVALDDTVVLANNLPFARRIIDVVAYGADRFLDQPVMNRAGQAMRDAQFALPGPQDLGSGFIELSRIRQGLHGHLPEVAAQSLPDDAQIRKELEADLAKRGVRKSIEEVDELVLRERERRIEREVRESERSLRPMRHIDWIAYGIREMEMGIRLRLMLTLK